MTIEEMKAAFAKLPKTKQEQIREVVGIEEDATLAETVQQLREELDALKNADPKPAPKSKKEAGIFDFLFGESEG